MTPDCPFTITVLFQTTADRSKLVILHYETETLAWVAYDAVCGVQCATFAALTGPDDEVLASWDRSPAVEGV